MDLFSEVSHDLGAKQWMSGYIPESSCQSALTSHIRQIEINGLFRNLVLCKPLFHERHEERAWLSDNGCLRIEAMYHFGISLALYSRLRPHHADLAVPLSP